MKWGVSTSDVGEGIDVRVVAAARVAAVARIEAVGKVVKLGEQLSAVQPLRGVVTVSMVSSSGK